MSGMAQDRMTRARARAKVILADLAGRVAHALRGPRVRTICGIALAGVALVTATLLGISSANEAAAAAEAEQRAATETHTYQIANKDVVALARPETPRSQWKQGAIPWLYQFDAQWASVPYGNDTVEKSGCGPTCLTMVYIGLTGKSDMTPADMAAYSTSRGYVEQGKTAWALMSQGSKRLGLRAQALPLDHDTVLAALEEGKPVICSVRPGDFTQVGHFIVLAGVASDGKIVVHDPNSAERSFVHWDLQRVLDQCNTLWAFTAA